ncbi:MAG: ABC transporter permease [Candidatus Izemoplasmatales bacterium]
MADKRKEERIDKSQFEFVQAEEKIYDKKFQTKPIGYFKDAMIRFVKNKTNVVATTILAILILLSIFVPILSTKNATVLESQISQLPPRVPFLDRLGIADGTKNFEQVPTSYDNPYIPIGEDPADYDSDELLYMPEGEFYEYIEEGSLTNYWLTCTDRRETCEGGSIQVAQQLVGVPAGAYFTQPEVDEEGDFVRDEPDENNPKGKINFKRDEFPSISEMWIQSDQELLLSIKIDEEHRLNQNLLNDDDSARIRVYMELQNDNFDSYVIFDTEDNLYDNYQDGLYTIDINSLDIIDEIDSDKFRLILEYDSDIKDSLVLEYISLEVTNDTSGINSIYGYNDDYLHYSDAYFMSQYSYVIGNLAINDQIIEYNTNILRIGGQRLNASYTLDTYGRAFGPVEKEGFPGSEYLELIEGCNYIDGTPADPDETDFAEFDENCPIMRLYQRNDDDAVTVPGKGTFYTYDLQLNYRVYAGYEEIPYFLFGTSAAGYDMVKLIWIGLRTSLLIGLVVSAINIFIGVIYGAISGYYGGQVDIIMQRFAEIVGRIPWLVTLSIFMAYFNAGFTSLILILIVSGWIGVSAITRTQFYRYKGREYVLASRTLGAKDGRLIFRHILPNGIGTIITSSILMIPTVIFSEATLSYLGFGIGHGQALNILGFELSGVSIGVLLSDGRNKLRNYPHLTIYPAIIISILMITFNMFGNALRDAFNPALRGSE